MMQRAGFLGSYDFTGTPPYQDASKFIAGARLDSGRTQAIHGHSRAGSGRQVVAEHKVPVENLTREISEIQPIHRPYCHSRSRGIASGSGRIVSLSQSANNVNFHLRQEAAILVFFFRNPLSAERSMLAWRVRGVFQAGENAGHLFATYDGSDAFMFSWMGIVLAQSYHLSPGASLMHSFYFVRTRIWMDATWFT